MRDVCGELLIRARSTGDNVVIENSVIGLRTVIGDNVTIKDSVVMGADFIEPDLVMSRDGVLLVVREGTTNREAIRHSLQRLERAGVNVVGIVLNGSRLPSYYKAYKKYGYGYGD